MRTASGASKSPSELTCPCRCASVGTCCPTASCASPTRRWRSQAPGPRTAESTAASRTTPSDPRTSTTSQSMSTSNLSPGTTVVLRLTLLTPTVVGAKTVGAPNLAVLCLLAELCRARTVRRKTGCSISPLNAQSQVHQMLSAKTTPFLYAASTNAPAGTDSRKRQLYPCRRGPWPFRDQWPSIFWTLPRLDGSRTKERQGTILVVHVPL